MSEENKDIPEEENENDISLAALYARDPKELTDADILLIIQENRRAYQKYAAGDKAAGRTKKKPEKKAKISLSDLGL